MPLPLLAIQGGLALGGAILGGVRKRRRKRRLKRRLDTARDLQLGELDKASGVATASLLGIRNQADESRDRSLQVIYDYISVGH